MSKERQIEKYIELINEYHSLNKIEVSSIYLPPLQSKNIDDFNINDDHAMIIGEYDDYINLSQGTLIHDFKTNHVILSYYRMKESKDKLIKLALYYIACNQYEYTIFFSNRHIYDNHIECIDTSNEEDIIYTLNEIITNQYHIFIIIDDYETFIQSEKVKELFDKLLTQIHHGNLHMIINIRLSSMIPYKYRLIFKKYTLDIVNKEEIINIFSQYNEVSEDAIFESKDNQLIGFKMADINSLKQGSHHRLLKTIPKGFNLDFNMLGFDKKTRDAYYLSKEKILATGFNIDEINKLKDIIKTDNEIDYLSYKNVIDSSIYDSIIWLGHNIMNQYLFMPKVKNLNESELYYVKGNIHKIIRYE